MVKKSVLPPEFPKTVKELEDYAKPIPPDTSSYLFLTHAVGIPSIIDSIVKNGIQPSYSSKRAFFSPNGLVRNKGHGYVVIKITRKDYEKNFKKGVDVVEAGLKYPEITTTSVVRPDKLFKVVPSFSGVNADVVAKYAIKNQGLNNSDVTELPDKYKSWFHIKKM